MRRRTSIELAARLSVLAVSREAPSPGVLYRLDGVMLDVAPRRVRRLATDTVVIAGGVPCVDPLTAPLDLAADVDDLVWEQALESALRRKLATIKAIEEALPAMSRIPGVARIRRVLALRPRGRPADGQHPRDADGAAGPDGPGTPATRAAVPRREPPRRLRRRCRPGVAQSSGSSSSSMARSTRTNRCTTPARDGRRRGQGLAVRPVHLDRGRSPADHHGETPRRGGRPRSPAHVNGAGTVRALPTSSWR